MRHSCFFAAISFTLLSGCGMEDTGSSSALNPATDVDYSLPSLTLTNQEGLEPVLPYTAFHDLYRGAEPLNVDEDEGFSTELQAHLDTFLNAIPNDSGTDYKSVRNPIDLMNEVIRSGQVDNFNEGRRLMVSSIRESRGATYNTPANKALIRFSENNSDENTPPEDKAWIYTMLDWTYNPAMGKVFRAMQFVATSPDQVDASTPEIASAAWSGRYAKDDFDYSGFNTPEYAATSLTGRTLGKVELLQEFIGLQRDALTLTGVSGFTINGIEPDCVKVVFQYNTSRVRVFISKNKQPKDPSHCGNQKNEAAALGYDMVTIENRQ